MAEELLVHVTPQETQVSLVDNGTLQEFYIERASRQGLVGNIYLGKVLRVLPGMQSAFVDIGLGRAAFLHVSDILVCAPELMTDSSDEALPDIGEVLQVGQVLPVQIVKDPIGQKGARLTTSLSLASRYLVFMPSLSRVGISHRIEEEGERERLEAIVSGFATEGGWIVRTAAESVPAEALQENRDYLNRLWDTLQSRLAKGQAGDCIFEDLPLSLRAMRDLVAPSTERIRVDQQTAFQKMQAFAEDFMPQALSKLEHYQKDSPLSERYQIDEAIKRALQRKVGLKSGGHLVIDQREALTTIDVNTGAFVGRRSLDETIFKTNLEAADEIARQLRVRNLGGIIIIDFIDMSDPNHRAQVLNTFEHALAADHVKTTISGVSDLGLVEMTRKRTRESLEQQLCEVCPTCQGRGTIKTVETICLDIMRDILHLSRRHNPQGFLVLAAESVVDRILSDESAMVADLADAVKCSVQFQAEPEYGQENFDVVLM